jgi:hypothetical protein
VNWAPTGKKRCAHDSLFFSGARVEDVRSLIKANFRPQWPRYPRAKDIVLWLGNNLGAQADEIIDLARQYYKQSAAVAYAIAQKNSLHGVV